MEKQKHQSIVYNADGVNFTIYATAKPTQSGPKVYWVLVDHSTGKRRLLNNKSLKAPAAGGQNQDRAGQRAGEPDGAQAMASGRMFVPRNAGGQ